MKYLKNSVTLKYFPDKCVGCGKCVEVCPREVFIIQENKALITDRDLCIECGACMNNCQPNAIEVNAGVGCAGALIYSMVTGREPACGCCEN